MSLAGQTNTHTNQFHQVYSLSVVIQWFTGVRALSRIAIDLALLIHCYSHTNFHSFYCLKF